jgi:hypothetical protein
VLMIHTGIVSDISSSQDFHFCILSHSSTQPAGSFATAILHSRRQRGIGQLGVRLRDGVNRHLDPFPIRFLEHLVIPPVIGNAGSYPARRIESGRGLA